MPDWLITGCSQLLTLRGSVPRRGRALHDLGIIRDGALLVRDDRIIAVGPRRRIERMQEARRAEKLDLRGRVLLPGFVDSHTHLIFPESRADEYEQRISGKTYEQIARAGGGIRVTVTALRRTSTKTLFEHADSAFQASGGRREASAVEDKIARLESKLQQKNEVIAELMEENVRAKKANGEL